MKKISFCAVVAFGVSLVFLSVNAMNSQAGPHSGCQGALPLEGIVRSALDRYVGSGSWLRGSHDSDPQGYTRSIVDNIKVNVVPGRARVGQNTDLYVLCQSRSAIGLGCLLDFDKDLDGKMRLSICGDKPFLKGPNRFFRKLVENMCPLIDPGVERSEGSQFRIIYVEVDLLSLDFSFFDKPGVKPSLTGDILRQIINFYSIGEGEDPPCVICFSGGDYADAVWEGCESANFVFNVGPKHRKTIGSRITLSLLGKGLEFEPKGDGYVCDLVDAALFDEPLLEQDVISRPLRLTSGLPFIAEEILARAGEFADRVKADRAGEEEGVDSDEESGEESSDDG